MENAEALGTAASASARGIENDVCTSMESQGTPDGQLEGDRKQTDGGDNPMDPRVAHLEDPVSVAVDNGEQTRSDELLQNVSLPSQQVTGPDAEVRSSKDVPGGSADNDQRCREEENVAEKMSDTVGHISCAIPHGDIAKYVGKLVIFAPVLRDALLDALPIASLVIEKEKELEQHAFAVFSSVLKTVASKSSNLKRRADEFFGNCVAVADSDGSRCFVNAIFWEIIDCLDRRLKTVECYVRVAYAEYKEVPDANTSDNDQKEQEASIVTLEATMNSGKSHANITGRYLLPMYFDETLRSILRKRLMENGNVEWTLLVSEYVKLRKFCALGSVYAYKIKLSCTIVLSAVISVVNVVRPALESTSIMREAFALVGKCGIKGLGSSAFLTLHDVKMCTELAFLAVTHAEAMMKLHSAVTQHLKEARKQLESMMSDEVKVADVIYHGNRFRQYLRDHGDHPSRIRRSNITESESEAAFLKNTLSRIVEEVNKGTSLIVKYSEKSSIAVLDVLRAMNAATERSFCAIETSLDAFQRKLATLGD